MPYCQRCGAEVQPSDTFCKNCGTALNPAQNAMQNPVPAAPAGIPASAPGRAQAGEMNVIISPARVIIVGVLSFGLYLFYWFYLTWKHYRDYTRKEAYPVWHALSLFVPIYSYFRMHAHVRSFKELMQAASVPNNLRPGMAVVLLIISSALGGVSFSLSFSDDVSSIGTVIDIGTMIIDVGLLLYVQTNLNRFWQSLKDVRVTNARIGVGEVIFILIGILAWIGTFLPPEVSPLMSG